MIFVFLFSDEIAETDADTVSSDSNWFGKQNALDRRAYARARTDRAWSAAATPVIQPPCAVEKSCGEHASPAKNSRSSTGAANFLRQSAMPGRAYEYEPREYGSEPQRWIRMGLTRSLKVLPSRPVSSESEKSKNACSPPASSSLANRPPKYTSICGRPKGRK